LSWIGDSRARIACPYRETAGKRREEKLRIEEDGNADEYEEKRSRSRTGSG
jgi:hypothetical protein